MSKVTRPTGPEPHPRPVEASSPLSSSSAHSSRRTPRLTDPALASSFRATSAQGDAVKTGRVTTAAGAPTASGSSVQAHVPGRYTGASGLLVWVNEQLHEDLTTMEELGDGVVFCRLLDRLFHSTFPLRKLLHGGTAAHKKHNYRELHAFLIKQKIRYQPDVPRLVQGDAVAVRKLCQWVRDEYGKAAGRNGKCGQWVYDAAKPYESKARLALVRTAEEQRWEGSSEGGAGSRVSAQGSWTNETWTSEDDGQRSFRSRSSMSSAWSVGSESRVPGRFAGDAELLGWVNGELGESYDSLEALQDGTVAARLLDRLFHSTFPLHKLGHGDGPDERFHNYRELHAFLLTRKIRYTPDIPRLVQADHVALRKLFQWIKQEYEKCSELRSRRPGKWVYESTREYRSAERRALIRAYVRPSPAHIASPPKPQYRVAAACTAFSSSSQSLPERGYTACSCAKCNRGLAFWSPEGSPEAPDHQGGSGQRSSRSKQTAGRSPLGGSFRGLLGGSFRSPLGSASHGSFRSASGAAGAGAGAGSDVGARLRDMEEAAALLQMRSLDFGAHLRLSPNKHAAAVGPAGSPRRTLAANDADRTDADKQEGKDLSWKRTPAAWEDMLSPPSSSRSVAVAAAAPAGAATQAAKTAGEEEESRVKGSDGDGGRGWRSGGSRVRGMRAGSLESGEAELQLLGRLHAHAQASAAKALALEALSQAKTPTRTADYDSSILNCSPTRQLTFPTLSSEKPTATLGDAEADAASEHDDAMQFEEHADEQRRAVRPVGVPKLKLDKAAGRAEAEEGAGEEEGWGGEGAADYMWESAKVQGNVREMAELEVTTERVLSGMLEVLTPRSSYTSPRSPVKSWARERGGECGASSADECIMEEEEGCEEDGDVVFGERGRAVRRCMAWLAQDDRLQTCDVLRDSGDIFNGSALLSALLSDERGGSAVDLDEAEVKSVAEALKLALCSLSPPILPHGVCAALLEPVLRRRSLSTMVGVFRAQIHALKAPHRALLRDLCAFLRLLVLEQRVAARPMGVGSVCRVMAAPLLRPSLAADAHAATLERSGKLATLLLVLLLSDTVLDSSFHPASGEPCGLEEMVAAVRREQQSGRMRLRITYV